MYAVRKWDHYIAHRHFLIKTDHHSLKFLLEQRITTTQQQKYIAKLFRYDFKITYKKGSDNTAADALSRLPSSELVALTLSSHTSSLLPEIEASWQNDPHIQAIIAKL